ncbi:MAG: AMP-binding protein [Bacteroidales bacterium]|nr:AMP-binding protein [Bacteroidales bacterium]
MSKRITIIDFVERYTKKFAKNIFLREKIDGKWQETTFAQTREMAHVLGAGLLSMGMEKGDKVALLSEGRSAWVLGELGILYAGGIDVPLSINLEEGSDLIFRIVHSESKYVMTSAYQLPKILRILDSIPAVEKIFVFDNTAYDLKDEELHPKIVKLSDVEKAGREFLSDPENKKAFEERYHSIGPDDVANISYTSGTTADPKGIMLTHRNYTANVEQARSVISVDEGDTMLIILPLDHCFAHVAGFYTMMSFGSSIATVPIGKTPMATLKNIPSAIKETQPAVMLSVPAIARNFKKNIENGIKAKGPKVQKLYDYALQLAISYNKEYYNAGGVLELWKKPLMALFDKLIFKNVRESFGGKMKFFVGGGALLDIELQRYFCAIGIPMFQGYGLSEATPIICANSMGHARFGSSGRIVKPLDIKICDGDGNSLPYGERGEIVIRGENVMAGYWKNPKATADTVRDGWLYTGDMGYMLDDEYLYVTGRFKSLLISADGEKYSPEGFEDSLTDGSPYIEQVIIHNNQNPYTIVLIVPNKEALREYVKKQSAAIDLQSNEARKMMLDKIQDEINSYKKGGKRDGLFPERWLPAAVAVLPEPFTQDNGMVNSTSKIVRGKVEKFYEDRIEYAYTPEGKNLYNEKNLEALK